MDFVPLVRTNSSFYLFMPVGAITVGILATNTSFIVVQNFLLDTLQPTVNYQLPLEIPIAPSLFATVIVPQKVICRKHYEQINMIRYIKYTAWIIMDIQVFSRDTETFPVCYRYITWLLMKMNDDSKHIHLTDINKNSSLCAAYVTLHNLYC